MFMRDPGNGKFLLAKDFDENLSPEPLSGRPVDGANSEYQPISRRITGAGHSAFHQSLHTPMRLTLPGNVKGTTKLLNANAKLKQAVDGKELVKIKGEDIGVEAIDNIRYGSH